MHTAVCGRLGIEFPVVAFSHCPDAVAAVTNAGAFGVLGASAHSPRSLDVDLTWIDEQTKGEPYGVDLLLPVNYAYTGPQTPATPQIGPHDPAQRAPSTAAPPFPPGHQAFVENLLACDDVPGLPELPEVVGSVAPTPALAAGEIVTGAQVAAALALGAEGELVSRS